MRLADLKNKQVAILGYGTEGKTVVAYLVKHGIKPALFDQKPWEQWEREDQTRIELLGLNFIFGADCFKELTGFDFAFRSPGISLSKLQTQNSKLQITSQTKFFFDNCPAKIIGVTGTKGKGTTSALIYEMLERQRGESNQMTAIYLTGNIGTIQPLEILDILKFKDWVIYELSSFQLQDLRKSPHIGVVLMVTAEHLDYHKDNNEYISAKEPIVKFQSEQDFAIVNADFESSLKIGSLGKGKKVFFSRAKQVQEGCFVDGSKIMLTGADLQLTTYNLLLRGSHNLENVCASILAARCAGASLDAIKIAAKNFNGLEHRLEFVAEKGGIKFYNDSFSTTPETAIAAIQSFSEPLILILGGSSKNADFSSLSEWVGKTKNIKAIILVGQETKNIMAAIVRHKIRGIKIFEGAESMKKIFYQINKVAEIGDTVLLSPACASFGMFKNYKDRGEQFKKIILSF